MAINQAPYVLIEPRICRAHSETTFTIKPRYEFVSFEGEFKVSLVPRYRFISGERAVPFDSFTIAAQDNMLQFTQDIEDEQEYILVVTPAAEGGIGRKTVVVSASIYALDDDLYHLKVMKGELHQHTTFSDGLESPDHRIVESRRRGMDFMAITDHNKFDGSVRTVDLMKRLPLNMVAIHGEEVHADHCPVHILSLGATESVVPLVFNAGPEEEARVRAIAEKHRGKLDDEALLQAFASAMNVFDRIREKGGLSVLCHIYWESLRLEECMRMGAPEQIIDALADECAFDAFEITSGAPQHDLYANYLQEAYYYENLPENFPIIGITDSHSTLPHYSIFGDNYTIAFVDDCSEQGVIDAIRNSRVVAYDGVGSRAICHGSLRLRKYALFLTREYFPYHDAVLAVEGDLLDRILRGDMSYLPLLEKVGADNKALFAEWPIFCADCH